MPKKVRVKQSRPHQRGGGLVKGGRGYVRKQSRVTVNKAYTRNAPQKKSKKKRKKPKKTRQIRFGKPRTRPAQRSLKKRKS